MLSFGTIQPSVLSQEVVDKVTGNLKTTSPSCGKFGQISKSLVYMIYDVNEIYVNCSGHFVLSLNPDANINIDGWIGNI